VTATGWRLRAAVCNHDPVGAARALGPLHRSEPELGTLRSYPSICLSIWLSIYLCIHPSICMHTHVRTYVQAHMDTFTSHTRFISNVFIAALPPALPSVYPHAHGGAF
jgi:hypothetical protein